MLLPEGRGQMLPYRYAQVDFVADVLERVPEIEKYFDMPYQDDGLHILLPALARLIRASAKKQNSDVLERAFGLVNEAIERDDADPEIENAAQISFLEPPDVTLLRDRGAWRRLSPELKRYAKGEYV